MEKLKKILREFDNNRSLELKAHGESHFPNNETSDSRIASCFHPIADEILYHGHFVVKSKIDDSFTEYGIRIDALELYYNEELEGGYEDKKMYHINDRKRRNLCLSKPDSAACTATDKYTTVWLWVRGRR